MDDIFPIVLAISAMFSWGIAPIIYKPYMSGLDGLKANIIKNNFAALLSIAIGSFFIVRTSINLSQLVVIVIATIMNIIIGDIFYMESIRRGGVSIGTPISYTFQIFVLLFSWLFLGEKITYVSLLGSIMVFLGIFLVSYTLKEIKDVFMGVIFGIITAIIWAIGLTLYGALLKGEVAPEVMIFVRGVIIILTFGPLSVTLLKRNIIKKKNIIMLNIGGVFGILLGSYAYYYAVHLSGNLGIITVISSASPAFSIILSQILYKEGKGLGFSGLTYLGITLVFMGILLASIGGV